MLQLLVIVLRLLFSLLLAALRPYNGCQLVKCCKYGKRAHNCHMQLTIGVRIKCVYICACVCGLKQVHIPIELDRTAFALAAASAARLTSVVHRAETSANFWQQQWGLGFWWSGPKPNVNCHMWQFLHRQMWAAGRSLRLGRKHILGTPRLCWLASKQSVSFVILRAVRKRVEVNTRQ